MIRLVIRILNLDIRILEQFVQFSLFFQVLLLTDDLTPADIWRILFGQSDNLILGGGEVDAFLLLQLNGRAQWERGLADL